MSGMIERAFERVHLRRRLFALLHCHFPTRYFTTPKNLEKLRSELLLYRSMFRSRQIPLWLDLLFPGNLNVIVIAERERKLALAIHYLTKGIRMIEQTILSEFSRSQARRISELDFDSFPVRRLRILALE